MNPSPKYRHVRALVVPNPQKSLWSVSQHLSCLFCRARETSEREKLRACSCGEPCSRWSMWMERPPRIRGQCLSYLSIVCSVFTCTNLFWDCRVLSEHGAFSGVGAMIVVPAECPEVGGGGYVRYSRKVLEKGCLEHPGFACCTNDV